MPRSQVQPEKAPYSGGNVSVDSAPPFLPLEESNMAPPSSGGVGVIIPPPPRSGQSTSSERHRHHKIKRISKKKDDDIDDSDDDIIVHKCSDDFDHDDILMETSNKKKKNKQRSITTTATAKKTMEEMKKKLLEIITMIKSWTPQKVNGKTIFVIVFVLFFLTIIWESFFVDVEDRWIQPDFSDKFLLWVEDHPSLGLGAISLVMAVGVVSMIPIGTPLVLGCGYIYRGVYGWKLGLFVATVVSMAGSCLGAVICFLLGRYLMRDTVQKWVRNYPLFDAIDIAASKQGLKIMAMLYLTPVLPLGLVSYMCGTTSMRIYHFAIAKVFSAPLYLVQTFIGASAHSFIKRGGGNNPEGGSEGGGGEGGVSMAEEAKQLEENEFLIVSGILLSLVMITLITRHIKKELMKILDQQKKEKTAGDVSGGGGAAGTADDDVDETGMEMGLTARRRGGNKPDYPET